MSDIDPVFYPDISDVRQKEYISKIGVSNLEYIVYKICALTGLNKTSAELLLTYYWQEIANNMLEGNVVIIKELGKFYISSPKTSGKKFKIFPKLKPSLNLLKELNDRK